MKECKEIRTDQQTLPSKAKFRYMPPEQKRFCKKCAIYGIDEGLYLHKAMIWYDSLDDYMEMTLTGFSASGEAVFSASLDEDYEKAEKEKAKIEASDLTDDEKEKALLKISVKEHHRHLSIVQALLSMKFYDEELIHDMTNGTFPKDRFLMRKLSEKVCSINTALAKNGWKTDLPHDDERNYYGSPMNASLFV